MNIKKFSKRLLNAILTALFLLVFYFLGTFYQVFKYLEYKVDSIGQLLFGLFLLLAVVVLSYVFIKYWLNFRQISKSKKIILIIVSAVLLIYTAFPLIVNDYCCDKSDCVFVSGIKCCPGPMSRWYDSEAKNKRYQVLMDIVEKIKCFKFISCPLYDVKMDMIIGPPSFKKELVCVSHRCQISFDCEEICEKFNSLDENRKETIRKNFPTLFIDECKCE